MPGPIAGAGLSHSGHAKRRRESFLVRARSCGRAAARLRHSAPALAHQAASAYPCRSARRRGTRSTRYGTPSATALGRCAWRLASSLGHASRSRAHSTRRRNTSARLRWLRLRSSRQSPSASTCPGSSTPSH
eukprot:840049-Rhodomonas_salina.1